DTIQAAELVHRLLDHVLAALSGGDGVHVGDGLADAAVVDRLRDLRGGAGVRAGAVQVHAGVVDHDAAAELTDELGDLAADAAAGTGHDVRASLERSCHFDSLLSPTP